MKLTNQIKSKFSNTLSTNTNTPNQTYTYTLWTAHSHFQGNHTRQRLQDSHTQFCKIEGDVIVLKRNDRG